MNRDGPIVVALSYRSCAGCKVWSHRLVRSGLDPIYENSCKHPESGVSESEVLIERLFGGEGRLIGRSDRTPEWCPFLSGAT